MLKQGLIYNIIMNEDVVIKLLEILVGLIIGILGFLGGILSKSKKQAVVEAKRNEKIDGLINTILYELKEVKQRLDEHNHYAEKFADSDKRIIMIQKDIEYLRKDYDVKNS